MAIRWNSTMTIWDSEFEDWDSYRVIWNGEVDTDWHTSSNSTWYTKD